MDKKEEIIEFIDWWGLRCQYEDLDSEQVESLQNTLAYSKFRIIKEWQKFTSELKTKIYRLFIKIE